MKVRTPRWRVRILHILLLILIGVSAVPLWFFGQKMISTNQETLQREQNILQTNISRSLAKLISVHMDNLRGQLKEFFDDVVPLAAQIRQSEYASSQVLRERMQNFVANNPDFLYLTLLNAQARGVRAGGYDAVQDLFLRKELESAFIAARQGEEFTGDPQTISQYKVSVPGIVLAQPIWVEEQFLGMVGAVVSLAPVVKQLKDAQQDAGLEAYVVNKSGRLVAHSDSTQAVGRDLSEIPIVQRFLAAPPQAIVTSAFELGEGEDLEGMLGTHAPIGAMAWGVIVQKKLSEAYSAVAEMRSKTLRVGFLVVFLILIVGFLAAKAITSPIDNLTRTARSIAQRDFTQRADVTDRTEIGELAETFNVMAGDIQHYIADLEDASNKNRQLFLESLSMIAAAVDAKDPYTKGHSGRVSQFSGLIAQQLNLDEEEVDKIRISALLHDVGKIGVEDRVLKKPGLLTDEEFGLMKRHTVIGYEIVRQVKQLSDMLPGIRWHHEALNGTGYPDGKKENEIPLMPRIIAVADTLDAITTERPYQAARDFASALEILHNHRTKKYDGRVVDALAAVYEEGKLSSYETRSKAVIQVP